ncbi:MAG TPA: PAS-domain containing protein [Rhizomicrobium sp.]|nr:PAS-domain containing protein [Rhizomicrobium sp.]
MRVVANRAFSSRAPWLFLYGPLVGLSLAAVAVIGFNRPRAQYEVLGFGGLATAAFVLVCVVAGHSRRHLLTVERAVDALADGFVLYDRHDRVVLANRKYRELHAMNVLAGKPGTRFEDEIRQAIACGEIVIGDADAEAFVRERVRVHRYQAGTIDRQIGRKWVRVTSHPTVDGGSVAIHADISDLRSALDAAEAAERSLRAAIETISEGFAIYDAQDRLTLCNRRYRELFAESVGDAAPGTPFADILRIGLAKQAFPEAVGREAEWLAERLRQRTQQALTFVQPLKGNRWVLSAERRMADGGTAGLRIDITELKRAQASAEAAQIRMADFAKTASDWFWESDAEGCLTYLSERFATATGVSAASRMGARRYDLTRSLDPENASWDEHLRAVAARRPFRNFIQTVRFAHGTKHLSVSGKPLFDREGCFVGYRGVTRDVTGEIEAQRALARQKAALGAAVEKLKAADAAKSVFLANMSHELRTPLNAIIGFADMMSRAMIGPLEARYRNYAQDIQASGHTLLRIINDVLDASRLRDGALTLQDEPTDIAEMIVDCAQLVQDLARETRVQIVLDLPADMPVVLGDRLRVRQALLAVLSNAVKFNREGGRASVSVARTECGGIAIVVADTGIGMRLEDIPVAFEPFQQIDATFARRYGGIGLGLPLAKAFIELHGGKVEIDSEMGKGTTVRVWLPPGRIVDTNRSTDRRRGAAAPRREVRTTCQMLDQPVSSKTEV